jgi:hypothetical protein
LHPTWIVIADHAVYGNLNYQRVPYSESSYVSGIVDTVHQLTHVGTSIAFLGPIPQPAQDPVNCLARNISDIQACSTSLRDATSTVNSSAVLNASRATRSPFIPTTYWFCTNRECPTVVDHTLMYFDADHVSRHYAALISNVLVRALAGTEGL